MHAKAFPLFFHLWGQFCKVNISDNVSKKRIMNLCVIFSDVQVKKKIGRIIWGFQDHVNFSLREIARFEGSSY